MGKFWGILFAAMAIFLGTCGGGLYFSGRQIRSEVHTYRQAREVSEQKERQIEEAARNAAELERSEQLANANERCAPVIELYCHTHTRNGHCDTKMLTQLCIFDAHVDIHNYRHKLHRFVQKQDRAARAHERAMHPPAPRYGGDDWLGFY